ncbi:hypothetical protein EMIT0373P_10732 [Pseudomonas chlororaphis]
MLQLALGLEGNQDEGDSRLWLGLRRGRERALAGSRQELLLPSPRPADLCQSLPRNNPTQ